jgi:hypothetical protein
MQSKRRVGALAAGIAAISAVGPAAASGNAITGPSSSQSPYLVRSQPGVVTKSILTVGDAVGAKPDGTPYRMVGIPDGLGAFDNGDGTFSLLMNHELGNTAGVQRAHGATGAFVSKWTIEKGSLRVRKGEDLIQQISTWNAATGTWSAPAKGVALTRLCSADLPLRSALFDRATRKGFDGRLFLGGEEAGAEGRAFAHGMDGTSYELPSMGRMSFENVVASPSTGDRTVVVALDDTTPGQVYVYAGDKQAAGNPVERAGLSGGKLYGIKVDGFAAENTASGIPSGTTFTGQDLGDVRRTTGAALDAQSAAAGVTAFQRPEDGAWDTTDPRVFYFATTASFDGRSRLWRLTFNDPANPGAGGRIDMLLDGTEGQHMLDNITVNEHGDVLAQEDPGAQDHVAKIWRYTPSTDQLTEVAGHDPNRFAPGAPAFLTRDEESSGIIDVSNILGDGWYLGDVQAHYSLGGELVEGGQLLALHVPSGRGGEGGNGQNDENDDNGENGQNGDNGQNGQNDNSKK